MTHPKGLQFFCFKLLISLCSPCLCVIELPFLGLIPSYCQCGNARLQRFPSNRIYEIFQLKQQEIKNHIINLIITLFYIITD